MQYKTLKCLAVLLTLLAMDACGGSTSAPLFTGGVFDPPQNFANMCQSPRTGINPATNSPFPDQPGSTALENFFLRSWTNYYYLWYDEVVDADPNAYSTPAYFQLMKTTQTTSTGRPKDRFHFTYPSDQWYQLSQLGKSAGYGATWSILASAPPRQIVVAYTDPNTPAANANLQRGATVLSIDGVDAINGSNTGVLNAGLFPAKAGESHTFTVKDTPTSTPRTFTMVSADVVSTPVQSVKTIGSVGYMVFNDHSAPAEVLLVNAFQTFKNANITDLVLDLRYNGGGFLDIAAEVAYMIAGTAQTTGKFFEKMTFNDKYPNTNPITGEALTPIPFPTTTLGFSTTPGQTLPALGLSRVFVLATADTCSASESIVNALRGIDVDVIIIGSTTCGKPYGFYPRDNCGTTYFSIQFKDVNFKGFGDYADGFAATCSVADDYLHQLGDANEALLKAALNYSTTGQCPSSKMRRVEPGSVVAKPDPMKNRIMRR